jgi:hypothetical protein
LGDAKKAAKSPGKYGKLALSFLEAKLSIAIGPDPEDDPPPPEQSAVPATFKMVVPEHIVEAEGVSEFSFSTSV